MYIDLIVLNRTLMLTFIERGLILKSRSETFSVPLAQYLDANAFRVLAW
jgi:hypothetical protein